jgi:hypothetical protein
MAIDLIKRWKINRQRYKEKHVPFIRVNLKNGYEVPKYNYLFGRFEQIVNQVTKTYLENGYSKTEMINLICDRTGALNVDVQRKLKGEVSVSSWELFIYLDALGFSFNVRSLIDTKYTSTVEKSSRGSWIIIKASGLIQFTLKINQEDYCDFEIDFTTAKRKSIKPQIARYKREVLKAYDWYFLEQTGKTKRPFVYKKWEDAFRMKWYAKQFDFLHHTAKKIIDK